MNITGVPAYNKEVGAMRNASDNSSVMKRLIFIYPFGIDQSLVNIPFQTATKGDMDTLGDALRAFFSVSVLKEIFASNALNLVTLASTYQRLEREPVKSTVLINSLMRGGSTRDSNNPFGPIRLEEPSSNRSLYDLPQLDSSILQSKIDEKFKKIKDSLRQDPRLKKLLPFMEVITLGNMIDVPVITGTAPLQLDTGALFTFLAAAVANRRPISSWSDVKYLFSSIKNMPDQSVYDMFKILSNVEGKKDIPSTVLGKSLIPPPTSIGQKIQQLQYNLNREQSEERRRQIMAELDALNHQYAMNNIALLKDNKIKELERNFLFMTNQDQLLIRYGLSNAVSQSSYALQKVSAQTELLFSRTKQQMIDFLGGADSLFSSIYMMFSPMEQLDSSENNSGLNINVGGKEYLRWNHSYLSMKDDLLNSFSDGFDKFMGNFKGFFDAAIQDEITVTAAKIAQINKSCDGVREDFTVMMNFLNDTLSGNQVYPTFEREDLAKFTTAIDKIQAKFAAIKKTTVDSLVGFFGSKIMRKIDDSLNNLLSNTFDSFFTVFNNTRDPDSVLMARLYSAYNKNDPMVSQSKDKNGNPINLLSPMAIARRKDWHLKILTQMASAVKLIAQTVFLLVFRINLCDYVQIADVEFGAAKADVLDLPNYCLVLPLEILQALMILYTKRDLAAAVARSGSGYNPLNSSYIKGLVKTFRTQLKIPNLMVVDRKKNELYYSFTYLGNTAEKLKMQAVETFVKHHIQDNSSGLSQVYY